MADAANARADLVNVKFGNPGSQTDYHELKAAFALGGESIPIFSARFGETVGALVGNRGVDLEIELNEGSPLVERALMGFDAAGVDQAPAVGTAKPLIRIEIADPIDTARLGALTFWACELVSVEHDHDGQGLRVIKLTYRAHRDGNGNVWSVGAAA